VIHTREKTSPKHLALRVCIALAAALAERTHGFVYDEALRRIETPAELRRRVVLGAVTEPSFRPEHIALQAYTQEDGEERMLTLGMARFGAPDLEVRGFREESSPRAALLLNAIAAELAGGSRSSVVSLTTADVARANGKDERAFARSPGKGRFKLTPQEQHSAGDPDNELLTVSAEGTDVAAHGSGLEAALRATTGGGDMLTLSGDLPELVAIGQRVRADLPRIIASYKDHLHLKARFRTKTGTESMWLSVLACEHDACHGPLENEPVASADLTLGQDVRVRFEDIEDYFYELPDGGTIGGDSTRVIQARGK
jgi:uncharacterized protein YegJ (DUF2314 family)